MVLAVANLREQLLPLRSGDTRNDKAEQVENRRDAAHRGTGIADQDDGLVVDNVIGAQNQRLPVQRSNVAAVCDLQSQVLPAHDP